MNHSTAVWECDLAGLQDSYAEQLIDGVYISGDSRPGHGRITTAGRAGR